MDGGLAPCTSHRRERRLCAPDLQLSPLGHAGRVGWRHRQRFSGRTGPLSPVCGADLPVGVPYADCPQTERAGSGRQRVRGRTRLLDEGWHFGDYPGADRDTLNQAEWLHQLYTRADARFTGRATVPVLWDKKTHTIVNNESADIVRMFNNGFGELANQTLDLYPLPLRDEIDRLNAEIYPNLNNGVYRAGFATTQVSYEEAVSDVFRQLDKLESHLAQRPFLCGEQLTEADIRLFVTLVRFDAAYHGLFKCNLRKLAEYTHLDRYLRQMLAYPAFARR